MVSYINCDSFHCNYCCYTVLHKKQGIKRLQARSRKLTDDAMDKSMNEIDLEWFNQNNHKNVRDIAVVSDVWGKDVMVFEYSVELTQNQKFSSEKLNALKELLEKKLFNYAKQKKIQNMANKPPFIVSDIWQLENILHIDVAYIMNEATYKYLNDIEKLEPGFKK